MTWHKDTGWEAKDSDFLCLAHQLPGVTEDCVPNSLAVSLQEKLFFSLEVGNEFTLFIVYLLPVHTSKLTGNMALSVTKQLKNSSTLVILASGHITTANQTRKLLLSIKRFLQIPDFMMIIDSL